MEPVRFFPGEQDLRGGARQHRQRCAHGDGIAQPDGTLGGRDAHPVVTLASKQLCALVGVVPQGPEYGSGRREETVLTGGSGELGETRAEHKSALQVAGHETMVLERNGKAVRRWASQSRCGDELRQGGGPRLEGTQDDGSLVEDADATCVVHALILPSHCLRSQVGGSKRRANLPMIASRGGHSMAGTLAEKVWADHVVRHVEGEPDILYIDLHLIHEVTSPQAFDGLRVAGRPVRRPDLTLATEDHNVPTTPGPITDPISRTQVETLRRNCAEFGVQLYSMGDIDQGIVHIVGPQLGLTQPGTTIVCGDSHTSTHGAFGALAFGIGTSEVEHVMATQTLALKPFKTMAINVNGALPEDVTAKDVILAVIAKIGTGGGQGYVLEYRGAAIRAMSMEARMTVCNMSIEAGARAGLIAPDEITFDYLKGRPHAPTGADWDDAVAAWSLIKTDEDATFDVEVDIDASALTPFVTWGTNPSQGSPLGDAIPDPALIPDESERSAAEHSLEYMGLTAGTPLREVAVDTVFVGSCTNGRIEDLRAVASVIAGRRVADGVRMLVVPGSARVRLQAEAEGLDQVFLQAGAEWRLPGCSMCLGMNPDTLSPGERSASTSNRNFEGRQGKGGRTHLVSPLVAAATAVRGTLSSPSDLDELTDGNN